MNSSEKQVNAKYQKEIENLKGILSQISQKENEIFDRINNDTD